MSPRIYSTIRPFLFALPPEQVHALALSSLHAAHRLRLLPDPGFDGAESCTAMGLTFPNCVGLAAGFDKNARCIDALGALGFGFLEIGTVTPQPQSGQSRPRLFRLPAHDALINRMGFPNDGALAVAARLRRRRYRGIIGVNIGKNAATPLDRAIDDYVSCYRTLAPCADYVAINVSSPNTADLRRLQQEDHLRPILEALQEQGEALSRSNGRRIPLLVKVSPDLSDPEIRTLAQLAVSMKLDGLIATNTTIWRPAMSDGHSLLNEQGGLSGSPLQPISLHVIRTLRQVVGDRLAIVGVGGIASASDAMRTREAGADLIQIYTGMIYRGPALVPEVRSALRRM